MVGIRSFPIGEAYFQGRTVSFREGILLSSFAIIKKEVHWSKMVGANDPLVDFWEAEATICCPADLRRRSDCRWKTQLCCHWQIGKKQKISFPMTDPWEWYIYLRLLDFYGINVGKYIIHGSYSPIGFGWFKASLKLHISTNCWWKLV